MVGWRNAFTGAFTKVKDPLSATEKRLGLVPGQFTQTLLPTTRAGRRTNKGRKHPRVRRVVSSVAPRVVGTNTRGEVTHVTSSLLRGTRNKPTLRGTRIKATPHPNVEHVSPASVAFNHREPITSKVAHTDNNAPKIPFRVPEPPPVQKRKSTPTPPPPERRVIVRSGRVAQ